MSLWPGFPSYGLLGMAYCRDEAVAMKPRSFEFALSRSGASADVVAALLRSRVISRVVARSAIRG